MSDGSEEYEGAGDDQAKPLPPNQTGPFTPAADLVCDEVTLSWIRNRADEVAVRKGCRFDVERAEHAAWFFDNVLILYEGESAGEPFVLMPFARDFVMRLFGWVKWSKKWKRWVRRFKMAFLWVPKKNGKSPLLAGILLYLLTSDGEQGAKVYTAARDGKQALIAHRHAEKMVKKSHVLSEYLKVNKTTHTIEFERKDSYHFLICGDNVNSQEGLNGSCGIDEIHVVDADLFATLEYMTASRSEPLILATSTVGKDLESLAKEKFDWGRKVNAGEEEDIAFLHVEYGLPDTITDAELKIPENASPEEIEKQLEPWKAANPGWGITLDPDEFVTTIRRAQKSGFAWSRCKMYRGNQWQSGEVPWLDPDIWADNVRVFTEEDLKGCDCYGGIDLALTWDVSALVFVFPWGRTDDKRRLQQYRLLPYFYIPEAGFDQLAEKEKSAFGWRDSGALIVTPGNTFDEETFLEKILWAQSYFNVQGMAYDQRFANSLAQRLQDVHGFLIQNFLQNSVSFVGPIEYFEQAFIGGALHHNGNAVLTAHAHNVTVKEKPGGGKILDKPKKANHKKIDGISASVMGMGMFLAHPPVERNYYETHALEVG